MQRPPAERALPRQTGSRRVQTLADETAAPPLPHLSAHPMALGRVISQLSELRGLRSHKWTTEENLRSPKLTAQALRVPEVRAADEQGPHSPPRLNRPCPPAGPEVHSHKQDDFMSMGLAQRRGATLTLAHLSGAVQNPIAPGGGLSGTTPETVPQSGRRGPHACRTVTPKAERRQSILGCRSLGKRSTVSLQHPPQPAWLTTGITENLGKADSGDCGARGLHGRLPCSWK